jgi:argininosuccinate lyase
MRGGPQMPRETSRPLWAGRFAGSPAPEARALGRSLDFDLRLAAEDVDASVAHVHALEAAGLLGRDEGEALRNAIADVGAGIADGTFAFDAADEDIHSAIERGVTERLGDLGARLHTGRSRNDLVVADLRRWLIAASRRSEGVATLLVRTIVAASRDHAETIMPGTTHGRLAQPVTLGHHLLAHAWSLLRDIERMRQWRERASVSPLGAGALATSTLGLDPHVASAVLGFDRPFANSLDAVSDRDFVLEFCADAAILAMHLSRLAADIARWTDEALRWAELDDAYATGSSMMPQKRNPDTVELVRAKAARPASDFVRIAAVLQGLPLGYHRDLQEDKEAAFDAADTVENTLAAITGAVATLRFDAGRMRSAADAPELYATDVAEGLVDAGVPFRDAHARTGELLRSLADRGRGLRDVSGEEWAAFGLPDGAALLDARRSIEARSMPGGPSPASVRAQADAVEDALARGATMRGGDRESS